MPDLTAKQDRAILALLSERTIEDAAKLADVSVRSLYRWLADADFASAYRAARRFAVEQAIGRLAQSAGAAADRLVALLSCGRFTVELAAAKAVLEFALQGVELADLETRLAELEDRYHGE